MAQHNLAHFYGVIQNPPSIVYDEEKQEYQRASVMMLTLRSTRRFEYGNEDANLEYDQLRVFTELPSMVERIAQLKPNDIVIMKGCITTRNIVSTLTCEECKCRFMANEGKANENDPSGYSTSMLTFVTPIEFDVRNTGLTEEEALIELEKYRDQ